jgi:hypothetical protein
MAGILDKIKGMFSKENQAEMKAKAGEVKDKVDGLVDKAGDKIPGKAKDSYAKVSDKVEETIPGDSDHDGK